MNKKSKNQHPIPQAVLDEFKYLSDVYEGEVEFMGRYKGFDAYCYSFHGEAPEIGYPEIVLYNKGDIFSLTGFDGLSVIQDLGY